MSQEVMEPSLLLRAEEGARLVSLSRSKFFQMMQRGEVPGVIRFGRSVRVSRSALEQWIRERANDAGPTDGRPAA